MTEIKKSSESRDYKERFEFELTVNGNIICQRYFRINNFNPVSLRSYELTETIRHCVSVIDNDLKDKTQTYLEIYAPKIFDTVEQMENYIYNSYTYDDNRMILGEGLIVTSDKDTDYAYAGNGKAKALGFKIDDNELIPNSGVETKERYKFAFKVDGREVTSMEWDGYYPKFVRDKIDLSNKRGKFEDEDIDRLSFEQYILYKMVQGKSDLVYGLIKRICTTCSHSDNNSYTTSIDEIINGWNNSKERELYRLY